MSQVTQYEVRCPSCDVSFPVGTKRCIHCGSRTGPSRLGARARLGRGMGASEREEPGWVIASSETDVFPGAGAGLDEEAESPRRTLIRSAGTLIWIALLIGFSLLRACSEE